MVATSCKCRLRREPVLAKGQTVGNLLSQTQMGRPARLCPWKVPSLAKGGSIHWPWSMEESMMTCTPEACTGRFRQTGL